MGTGHKMLGEGRRVTLRSTSIPSREEYKLGQTLTVVIRATINNKYNPLKTLSPGSAWTTLFDNRGSYILTIDTLLSSHPSFFWSLEFFKTFEGPDTRCSSFLAMLRATRLFEGVTWQKQNSILLLHLLRATS